MDIEYQIKQIQGIEIKGNRQDEIFSSISSQRGFFEQDILTRWLPWYRDSHVILDVGANLGNHSLYWALHTKAEHIFAFEPYRINYDLLRSNAVRNQFTQITCEQIAVGGKTGKVKLAKPVSSDKLGNVVFEYCDKNLEEGDCVPVTTLDSYIQGRDISPVDFVKIDTEGFALEVLKGMTRILKDYQPAIWIEAEPDQAEDIFNILISYGYFLKDVIRMNLLFLPSKGIPQTKGITKPHLLYLFLKMTERALLLENTVGKAGIPVGILPSLNGGFYD